MHISSWYPTRKSPKTALWVERHIQALTEQGVKNKIYHVEAAQGKFEININRKELNGNRKYAFISKVVPWFVLELVAFLFVLIVLFKERINHYDVINFHIAYPNLVYWHWVKRWIKTPVGITEHWSAYHHNFGLPKSQNLPRVQRIFNNNVSLISVSKALAKDIKGFSRMDFPSYIVPNITDTRIFKFDGQIKDKPQRFFMVSLWKDPKDPYSVLRAFSKYAKGNSHAELIIGGYGPQIPSINSLVEDLSLQESVKYLGRMDAQEIASEMNKAMAFIHLSTYETFSVVCAEAVCCGCPVIASQVGGIPEFIHSGNGILINEHNELLSAMKALSHLQFDRKVIAQEAGEKFSIESVGSQYKSALKDIIQRC